MHLSACVFLAGGISVIVGGMPAPWQSCMMCGPRPASWRSRLRLAISLPLKPDGRASTAAGLVQD
eukprot:9099394-Pyramimonas_sp.AAC.1